MQTVADASVLQIVRVYRFHLPATRFVSVFSGFVSTVFTSLSLCLFHATPLEIYQIHHNHLYTDKQTILFLCL